LTANGHAKRSTTLNIHFDGCYDSPEQLEGSSSTKSDIWALGCLLYEIITHKKAFRNIDAVFAYQHDNVLQPSIPHSFTGQPEISSLVADLLHPDADMRPDVHIVCQRLTELNPSLRPPVSYQSTSDMDLKLDEQTPTQGTQSRNALKLSAFFRRFLHVRRALRGFRPAAEYVE
jgi:serine/threonine protein kinase